MERRISATRAVRDFSEVLNTIKFKNAHYIIERGGKPVASMQPVAMEPEHVTLGQLRSVLKKLPKLGDELNAFVSEVHWVTQNQPTLPTGDPWA